MNGNECGFSIDLRRACASAAASGQQQRPTIGSPLGSAASATARRLIRRISCSVPSAMVASMAQIL